MVIIVVIVIVIVIITKLVEQAFMLKVGQVSALGVRQALVGEEEGEEEEEHFC